MEQDIVLDLDDTTWEMGVEKRDKPVIVMFYSPTCPHCRTMEPFFREYAGEFKASVQFARLDITTSPWTAERYGIRGTPSFKFFCHGKPIAELVGAVYPAILKRLVGDMLKHGSECADKTTPIDYEVTGYG